MAEQKELASRPFGGIVQEDKSLTYRNDPEGIRMRALSGWVLAPLDRPTLRRFDSVRVGGKVAEVARILHLDSLPGRGTPVDLCTGVVTATFIKRRRVDVKVPAVELHGRLRKNPLFVTLDKLRAPCCVCTGVHQLVPVVASGTNEKISTLRRSLLRPDRRQNVHCSFGKSTSLSPAPPASLRWLPRLRWSARQFRAPVL